MKNNPLVLSSLAIALAGALAGCGGGSDSADVAATANAQNSAGTSDAANVKATANAAVNPTISCVSPSAAPAQSGGAKITADSPSADATRLYPAGSKFKVSYTTRPGAADTFKWAIYNTYSKVVASGSFAVPAAATTTTLTCTSTLAGFFALTGTLQKAGGQVETSGTRPNGFASFGVLPNLAGTLPAVTYANQDQHRFGMQGFNGNAAMLAALGITWNIDDRQMSVMEPNGRNTFTSAMNNLDPTFTSGKVMRLVRLDGIPAWASGHGLSPDYGYAPADLNYYANYLGRVGAETEAIRARYFPQQSANYYQVTWEPYILWKDTDANFVALYKAAYQGLHSRDPKAVVMGPAEPFPSLTTERLKRLAPLGFANYIDGVATHGYYDAGTSPSHPPERHHTDANAADAANSLPNEIRALRAEMNAQYKPGMKLFVTETGISYDLGSNYGPNYPSSNILFAQSAVVARTHLILLGEGADQTYVFFGPDFPGEVGYGTFFDLDNPQAAFGTQNISPKPAAMTVAAMTRILDGTTTLGPVKGTPSGVYAYSFQQLGGGKVITALWTHNNAVWDASVGFSATYSKAYQLSVDAPGTSGTVQLIDAMGNVSNATYTNGAVTLTLTEMPQYVVSGNASIAKNNATKPAGYVGS
ncbi:MULTISPECIES: hypothetical protein [unclassified Caballeronia]|uniref:hypothetical protein n=1 Tax=unclassified Caballeronia TaxID=2646786 RepID=UPI0028627D0D|nr:MULTISPECIES: hypothetical protein [unclassified Caballeronia]MDR5750684.1 hypothetical protein [Caballeronia sp. LZ024]MDR5842284.1 hypothetical protein [Caballeronia sp. LZ031]